MHSMIHDLVYDLVYDLMYVLNRVITSGAPGSGPMAELVSEKHRRHVSPQYLITHRVPMRSSLAGSSSTEAP